ncbi:MAG: serine/threonine-protein kinase [Pirellulales bacterium]|nr:serine/threonine-protein kinase [Pirellulales bacterium]
MDLTELGPYRIERELGRGGMGTVYAAIDETTGQKVAVKVLAPLLANQEGFRDRFESEIESLKALQHPHIVEIYAWGEHAGNIYYAMELVEGCSLEDELFRRRRFPWQEVCHIGIDLCRALKLAHDHGIIHRDIKPANLLWSRDEQVKLSDFGIARLFGNSGFTSEGGVLGTAEYMAPEQAEGSRISHHCDLYSLGGVMYALLAGRPPFQSKSMLKLLQMQRFTQPESVCKYAPETPKEFSDIILQLLEKEPGDRFPNALLVARRMEAMQKALSLRSESEQASSLQGSETSGFEIHPYDADDPEDEIGATIDIAEADLSKEIQGDSENVLKDGWTGGADHFTTVEEARREEEKAENRGHPLISGATWFLAAALLLTAGVGWYFLQPPSAQSLYVRISTAAANGRLVEVKEEVNQFLQYYSQDPRAATILGYQESIEGVQLKERAILQARLLNKKYRDSALGQEYLATLEIAATDPETAAQRLAALITLYRPLTEEKQIKPFIRAAEGQLPFIQQQAEERIAAEKKLISDRLAAARQAQRDDPEDTKQICRAIRLIYGDRPWAASLVQQAEELLGENDEKTTQRGISSSP